MKKTQLFEVSVSYGAVARGVVLVILGQKDAEIRNYLGGNLPGCGRFISTLRNICG